MSSAFGAGSSSPHGPGRFVVVEDEWIVAKDLERILVTAGYEVVATVTNPAQVPGVIAEQRPDLALFDIRLGPSADGIELASAEARRHGVGIVYVSAYADVSTLDRAEHEHCLGFIVKPFSESQVRATVKLALERKRRGVEAPTEVPEPASAASALGRLAHAIAELDIRSPSKEVDRQPCDSGVIERLSEREWEVLRGLIAHRRVGGIAKTLHISQHTVRNHLKSIYAKLDVGSQEELLERILRPGAGARPASRNH